MVRTTDRNLTPLVIGPWPHAAPGFLLSLWVFTETGVCLIIMEQCTYFCVVDFLIFRQGLMKFWMAWKSLCKPARP